MSKKRTKCFKGDKNKKEQIKCFLGYFFLKHKNIHWRIMGKKLKENKGYWKIVVLKEKNKKKQLSSELKSGSRP